MQIRPSCSRRHQRRAARRPRAGWRWSILPVACLLAAACGGHAAAEHRTPRPAVPTGSLVTDEETPFDSLIVDLAGLAIPEFHEHFPEFRKPDSLAGLVRYWGGCVFIGLKHPARRATWDTVVTVPSLEEPGVTYQAGYKSAIPADTIRAALRHLRKLGVEMDKYYGRLGILLARIDPADVPRLMLDPYVDWIAPNIVMRPQEGDPTSLIPIVPDSSLTSRCSRRGRDASG